MKFTKRQGLLVSIVVLASSVIYASTQQPSTTQTRMNYARALGWVIQPNSYNICDGYYRELPIPYTPNPFLKSQGNNYDIVADHTTYSFKGTSVLKGHVRVTQPNVELKSGKAYLYRNKKTGKINYVRLMDNVSLFQPGDLLVAKEAKVYLNSKRIEMHHVAYRMQENRNDQAVTVVNPKTGIKEFRRYQLNYWGHAKEIIQPKPKYYTLKNATFTTCPPVDSVWHLSASTINIDKKKQVGSAWNSALYIKKVPVFYFPYVSFPLSHKRKTGFLAPTYAITNASGVQVSAPFYWNIAPNYDALLTPEYLSDRGVMLSGLFRFLTKTSAGRIHGSYLPDDRAFRSFKHRASKSVTYQQKTPQGLKDLQGDSNNRSSFSLLDNTQFNQELKGAVDYNYVSDPYYIENLSDTLLNNSENQLLQKGEIDYQNHHWMLMGLVQNFQTLHPINLATVENQYARLPELQANTQYSLPWSNWQFTMATDAVNFYIERTPDVINPATNMKFPKPVIGQRVYLQPDLSNTITRPYGYLTTNLQLQLTKYSVRNTNVLNASNAIVKMPTSPDVAIPLFNLEGGLTFNRDFTFRNHSYLQTLEPHFYYLFVPFHNQNSLPVFDTTTQPFDYDFMFQNNRFVGVDRIGDANQVTLAVTTRFIDQQTGNEMGSASIGEIYYFEKRRVNLCYGHNCSGQISNLDKNALSPIAATATYNFTPAWSMTGDLSWDPEGGRFVYQNANVSYSPKQNNVLNLGYSLVQSGTSVPGQPSGSPNVRLKQINLSSAWSLTRHWAALGQYSYSWGNNSLKDSGGSTTSSGEVAGDHINAYLAGIQYNSCCWALRLIAARSYQGMSSGNTKSKFNNAVYLQLELKGLGAVGTDDPSGLLQSSIGGYQDHFGQVGNENIVI